MKYTFFPIHQTSSPSLQSKTKSFSISRDSLSTKTHTIHGLFTADNCVDNSKEWYLKRLKCCKLSRSHAKIKENFANYFLKTIAFYSFKMFMFRATKKQNQVRAVNHATLSTLSTLSLIAIDQCGRIFVLF